MLAGTCVASDDVSCVIEPGRVIDVSTAVEGVLEEVPVEKGAVVTAGEVLARLNSSVERAGVELARMRVDLKAQIAARRAELDAAERRRDRAEELFTEKFIPSEALDDARTDYEVARLAYEEALENQALARADLVRAQALYDLRVIRAPIAGVVVERFLSEGEFAQAQKILTLAEIDPLRVEVVAPIRMYGDVSVGMQATIRPESPIGGEYVATVTVVDQVIDAASGLFGIRLTLPNPGGALPAGVECAVEFSAL